ncbi:MAG: PEP-CTERM sorting domain-containing protein [Planctomycetota bacterium]|jgi:hypothetical protein
MKRKTGFCALMALVAFFAVFTSISTAGIVNIDRITTPYIMNTWYDYVGYDPVEGHSGHINFNNQSATGDVDCRYGDNEKISISGAKLTFVSELVSDYSTSGGDAKATFAGGVQVVLTGSFGGAVDQVLLQGTVVETQFVLDELSNSTPNTFQQQINVVFDKTIGLAAGITVGSDTYVMRDAQMDLALRSGSSVEDFITKDLQTGFTASSVDFTAVPEPMTLALVGMGALLLRKRK